MNYTQNENEYYWKIKAELKLANTLETNQK